MAEEIMLPPRLETSRVVFMVTDSGCTVVDQGQTAQAKLTLVAIAALLVVAAFMLGNVIVLGGAVVMTLVAIAAMIFLKPTQRRVQIGDYVKIEHPKTVELSLDDIIGFGSSPRGQVTYTDGKNHVTIFEHLSKEDAKAIGAYLHVTLQRRKGF